MDSSVAEQGMVRRDQDTSVLSRDSSSNTTFSFHENLHRSLKDSNTPSRICLPDLRLFRLRISSCISLCAGAAVKSWSLAEPRSPLEGG